MTPPIIVSNEVLFERMETLIKSVDSLRNDFKEANAVVQKIPVIEEKLNNLDGKMTRCFKAVAESEIKIEGNSNSIIAGRTASRILAGASTMAFGVLISFSSWAWGQLTALQHNDNTILMRLNSLEIKAIEAEKNADKLTKNGWVRNDK